MGGLLHLVQRRGAWAALDHNEIRQMGLTEVDVQLWTIHTKESANYRCGS